MLVPWNASWTSEERFEVRPCKYAKNQLAMWQPFSPNVGHPVFAKPHFVRQRKSIAEHRCTVCGEKTEAGDRFSFGHGEWRDGMWMTQESPVHAKCAEIAMRHCPVLRKSGLKPFPFPGGYTITASVIGGPAVVSDFGIDVGNRIVVGALKFAWARKPDDWIG